MWDSERPADGGSRRAALSSAAALFPPYVDPDYSVPPSRSSYATSGTASWMLNDPRVVAGDLGGAQVWVGRNPTRGPVRTGQQPMPIWTTVNLDPVC